MKGRHLKCVWIYAARGQLWLYFWQQQNTAPGLAAARPGLSIDAAELLCCVLAQKQHSKVTPEQREVQPRSHFW